MDKIEVTFVSGGTFIFEVPTNKFTEMDGWVYYEWPNEDGVSVAINKENILFITPFDPDDD